MPPRLNPGDRIAVAAPGGPFDRERFQSGVAVLESWNFEVSIPEGLFVASGYLAGSDAHRAGILNDLLADASIKAIFCARGGYGAMRILDHIDYAAAGRCPKTFVGFSDITALHTALLKRCGLLTFHGPMITSLADADTSSKMQLFDVITNGGSVRLTTPEAVVLREGRSSGVLIGGNLATLCHLVGTPWAPDFAGGILLLEDVNEAPYRVDRMLLQLKMAGCLQGIKGLVLGYFKDCGEPEQINAAVMNVLGDMPIPMLSGIQVGHGPRNMTLPLGITALMDTASKTLDCRYGDASAGV